MMGWTWRLGVFAMCGAVLVVPVMSWLRSMGNPVDYFRYALPPGQVLYVLSKLVGLVAFSLFWLQGLLALAQGLPVLRGFPRLSSTAHRNLGLATVVMALLHFGVFFSAASLRTGSPAWGLWVPQLTHGYYPFYLGLGLIALWLLILGIIAGWSRRRGGGAGRWAHHVWFVAFLLVFLHGFGVGSESRTGAMRYVSLFIVASLAVVALLRVFLSLKPRALIRRLSVLGVLLAGFLSHAATLPSGLVFIGLQGDSWRLFVVGASGKLEVVATSSEPRTPALSRDGKRVAYVSADGKLREVELHSGEERILLQPGTEEAYTQPVYGASPEDLYVVVLKKGNSVDTDIAYVERRGLRARPAVTQRSAQFEPHLSADGHVLLYSNVSCTLDCGKIIQELWAKDLLTGEAEQLTLLNGISRQPFQAPDGVIYFSSNRAGGYHIWRMARRGAPPEQLSKGAVTDESPVADGRGNILFVRRQREGVALMKMSPRGILAAVALPPDLQDIKDLRISQ